MKEVIMPEDEEEEMIQQYLAPEVIEESYNKKLR